MKTEREIIINKIIKYIKENNLGSRCFKLSYDTSELEFKLFLKETIPKEFFKDKKLANSLVSIGILDDFVIENFELNEKICLHMIKQSPYAFKLLPFKFRRMREVTYEAVKRDGYLLEYTSVSLKDDETIVDIAMNEDYDAYLYASERIKRKEEFMLKYIDQQDSFHCLGLIPLKFKIMNFVEIKKYLKSIIQYKTGNKIIYNYFDEDLIFIYN